MAQITSHQFLYDCESCKGVACYDDGRHTWKHLDRRSTCVVLVVVSAPLPKVLIASRVDNVELAA